tara:strand:- start:31 stop:1218 length:1188 start_codon:yes stop_codon:yes gene_type:complete
MGKPQQKAHVTQAINRLFEIKAEGNYEAIIKSAEKVVGQAKRLLELYPELAQSEPVKAELVKAEPIKKKTRRKQGYQNNGDNANKRENRKWIAQDWWQLSDKVASPVKKALIMPSENLYDVIQFFDLGLFNEETELICVEMNRKNYESWLNHGFGAKLRKTLKEKNRYFVSDAQKYVWKDAHFIHGEIGKKLEDGSWDVDLEGFDGIDFMHLDFYGVLKPQIQDWLKEVASKKYQNTQGNSSPAGINITLQAKTTTFQKEGAYKYVQENKRQFQMMIEEMELSTPMMRVLELVLDAEHETSDREDLPNEERKWEHVKTDNFLIQQALGDGFYKASDEPWRQATPFGDTDIKMYKGENCNTWMATHKFYYGNPLGSTGTSLNPEFPAVDFVVTKSQ